MRRLPVVFPILIWLLALAAYCLPQDKFKPGCATLSFEAIKKHHEIDADCSIDGNADEPAAIAQNQAKNNFCAQVPLVKRTTFPAQQAPQCPDRPLRPGPRYPAW